MVTISLAWLIGIGITLFGIIVGIFSGIIAYVFNRLQKSIDAMSEKFEYYGQQQASQKTECALKHKHIDELNEQFRDNQKEIFHRLNKLENDNK